ncbi:glutamine amidotransferase-related protein [Methylocystis parvus]|uniref:glutamine amidotransferase-related protein n=1 Tax=Methylocystis parvus TaxID=134 RepID=UPI003C779509
MAVIEAARALAGIEDANSTEFGPAREPVVGLMTEWLRGNELEQRRQGGRGDGRHDAARRLSGAGGRLAHREIYGSTEISERHRHRYEVNMRYRADLEKAGLRVAGTSPDGLLPETVEIPDHPWFIGVQYHPELKSRPFEPHPLFAAKLHWCDQTGRGAGDVQGYQRETWLGCVCTAQRGYRSGAISACLF